MASSIKLPLKNLGGFGSLRSFENTEFADGSVLELFVLIEAKGSKTMVFGVACLELVVAVGGVVEMTEGGQQGGPLAGIGSERVGDRLSVFGRVFAADGDDTTLGRYVGGFLGESEERGGDCDTGIAGECFRQGEIGVFRHCCCVYG